MIHCEATASSERQQLAQEGSAVGRDAAVSNKPCRYAPFGSVGGECIHDEQQRFFFSVTLVCGVALEKPSSYQMIPACAVGATLIAPSRRGVFKTNDGHRECVCSAISCLYDRRSAPRSSVGNAISQRACWRAPVDRIAWLAILSIESRGRSFCYASLSLAAHFRHHHLFGICCEHAQGAGSAFVKGLKYGV